MTLSHSRKFNTAWLWPLLFAVVIFVQESVGPRAGDSVEYAFVYQKPDSQQTYRRITSLADLAESQANFYNYENGRVALHSLVQPLCAMTDNRIFALLDAVVFMLLVVLMLRLLKWAPGHRQLLAVACGTYIYISPCSPDIAFQVNYLWTAMFVCLFILAFLQCKCRKWWIWPLLAALAFLTGESNEAFTGGIMTAILLFLITNRKNNTPQQYLLAVFFTIGFSVNVLAPGNLVKLSKFMTSSPAERLIHIALNCWYGFLLFMPSFRYRPNPDLHAATRHFAITSFAAQSIMMFVIGTVYLYACMGMRFMLILTLLTSFNVMRLKRWQGAAVCSMCLLYGAYAISDAYGKGRKFDYIRNQYFHSADGRVALPVSFMDNDYRHTPAYAAPMTLERRENNPTAPTVTVLPAGVEALPQHKDTNFIFTVDSVTWVTVQSKTHPRDFYLVKRLKFAGKRAISVRRIDTDPNRRLDFWTETDVWRMGVYHNQFRMLFDAEVTDSPPKKQ